MKKFFFKSGMAACVGSVALMAVSCHRTRDDIEITPKQVVEEDNVIPNDIAMTVSSLADAINMGEQLDSASYDYEGVMTDGRGAPLYTNMRGAPGEWLVSVTGDESVVIRNTDLGDLLPNDLCEYVVGTMGLTDDNVVESGVMESDEETEVLTYDIGEGMLRFEMRPEVASNGLEGVWLSIIIKKWSDN
jgi:hypothetical protein